MPMNKPHLEFHKVDMNQGWVTPPGYPAGIQQKILASDLDETAKMGSRTRLLRFAPGVYTTAPFVHDHWEEVYLLSGDLVVGNDDKGKGGEPFEAPTYACRPPGVYHGPFKSERGCMLYEIHYYDESKTVARGDKRVGRQPAMQEQTKPVMRPYLAAARNLPPASRRRGNFSNARSNCSSSGSRGSAPSSPPTAGSARGGGAVDRALARRKAAVADRRHARRHQGHYRDRRYADANGLAAVCRLAFGKGRRQRARAARRRRGDPRQDGDDGIRRFRAARHAQSVEHRAYAGRLVERLGGRGRRRHRQRRARHPGDRLDHPAGELLRLLSASSRASTRSTAKAATIIRARAAPAFSAPRSPTPGRSRTKSSPASAATPARPACTARTTLPLAEKPRRLAVLETAGWDSASAGAKQQFNECVMRLKSAGIEIRTRHNDDKVAALETDLDQCRRTFAPLQRLGDALVFPHVCATATPAS